MKTGNRNENSLLAPITFLPFFFIACCTLLSTADRPSYYIPPDNSAFDCSPSESSHDAGFPYSERYEIDFSSVSRVYAIHPSNREKPKISACCFRKQFSLPFIVSDGPKFLRLYFKPVTYSGLDVSKALFSISVGPYTLITTSESSYSKYFPNSDYAIREFCVNTDGQILNVTFTPSSKVSGAYAFVNKIEVVSMPSKLYIQEYAPLSLVGKPSPYSMGNSTALEMMHRVNIGGDVISGLEDTGMFRRWTWDGDYFKSNDGNPSIVESEVEIKSSLLVPAYAAPLQVYTSARTILHTTESKYRARWMFPVDYGFYYLVRLHFCEISRTIKRDGQRVFSIYINNQTAEDHADVFNWSHGAGIPIYRDYVVNFSSYGEGVKYLSIALGSTDGSSAKFGGPILNGLEIFKLSDFSNNLAGPHPFGVIVAPHPHFSVRDDAESYDVVIVARVVGSLLFAYCAIGFLRYCCLFSSRSNRQKKSSKQDQSLGYCRIFTIAETKSATNNFADGLLIGTGGFGKVYKGSIDGGITNVAIKRADRSSHQGLKEFQTEISMLSKLRHGHLVSLLGYCTEEKEMILVYEYMAQGTLRDHLYKTQKPPLPWKQRLKICIGAARGLHYLHTGAKHTIIHRDIKTTNILLDEKWVPKVSDFGLSKLGPNNMTDSESHVSTIVKGSFGYLDPEYYRRQKLTEKSDVYSFGVVLFEVLCARPAVIPMGEIGEDEPEKVSLAEWALHCCQMGTLDQIIDPYLKGEISPDCFKTFAGIARKCLEDRGSERPTMGDVLWNLELAMQQQEGVGRQEANGTMNGDLRIMIDNQRCSGFDISDPNPGVEFSDIMVPTGR
jgi:serine/threonine protein kinase